MKNKDVMTVSQLAEILGISRVAVFKKIKKGEIKAIKVGRIYIIPVKSISQALGTTMSDAQRHSVERAVRKAVNEYSDVLKWLGND